MDRLGNLPKEYNLSEEERQIILDHHNEMVASKEEAGQRPIENNESLILHPNGMIDSLNDEHGKHVEEILLKMYYGNKNNKIILPKIMDEDYYNKNGKIIQKKGVYDFIHEVFDGIRVYSYVQFYYGKEGYTIAFSSKFIPSLQDIDYMEKIIKATPKATTATVEIQAIDPENHNEVAHGFYEGDWDTVKSSLMALRNSYENNISEAVRQRIEKIRNFRNMYSSEIIQLIKIGQSLDNKLNFHGSDQLELIFKEF